MKIYLVTFNQCTYDQYDAFVVRAKSPAEVIKLLQEKHQPSTSFPSVDWSGGYKIDTVGVASGAADASIILASYNAG